MTAAVRSVERAFELLEAFRETRVPLRLRDLVIRTGHPSSSVADLLKTLTGLGYLNFDRHSQNYFPTPRLAALGDWVPAVLFQDGRIGDALQSLSRATGEAIVLGAASGVDVQYLDVIASTMPVQYVTNPGARRPLIRSGVGWALLAAEDAIGIERIYRTSAAIDRRVISLPQVTARVAEMRQHGYVYSRNTVHEGAGMVAALVPGMAPFGRRLAVGIAGPTERMDRQLQDYGGRLTATISALT